MTSFIDVLITIGDILATPYHIAQKRRLDAEIASDDAERKRLAQEKVRSQYRNIQGPYGNNEELWTNTKLLFEAASFPLHKKFCNEFILELLEECEARQLPQPHYEIGIQMLGAAAQFFALEQFDTLPPDPTPYGVSAGLLRDYLILYQRKIIHPSATLRVFSDVLLRSFLGIASKLPPLAQGNPAGDMRADEAPSLPLLDLLPDVGEAIHEALAPFSDPQIGERGLFDAFQRQLTQNTDAFKKAPKRTPTEIAKALVGNTPFERIFLNSRVPFAISSEDRGEHTAIVAGSGWGKTQLLQSIVAADLEQEDPPGIVVIDSTGAMVQRIQRLALFNERLKDRLLIIDPELEPAPALNMFDHSTARFETYTRLMRDTMESEIISLFNYVFSSIENPLTAQQMTPFTFMVRLMLSIPGANLNTMVDLLEDNPREGYAGAQEKFKTAIERLDPTTQNFFKTQFYSRGTSEARRDQIAQRIYAVIKVPAFERMFSTVNKVDMFAELNKGSIVLINTSENYLKEASVTFGRYMIARVMAAAFERASIAPEKRRQAFLIIDEAAPYFDEQFEKLLNRIRQFKLGTCIAFQNLEQATEKLRSTIASSTAVKYGGGTGYSDARWLAREMRVDPEFILAQKRDGARPPKWTQFACYVRNQTERAVSLTVPFYTIENMPKMTEEEHRALLEHNRTRVSGNEKPSAATTTTVAAPSVANELEMPKALATSYAQLAEAITKSDWDRVAELRTAIIPELERNSEVVHPRPTARSPDLPRPAVASDDDASQTEGAKEWR